MGLVKHTITVNELPCFHHGRCFYYHKQRRVEMLGRLGNAPLQCESASLRTEQATYQRNELEDLKKGIEYLYEFKEKLSKLHPIVSELIENMLQRPRYN